MAHIPKQDYYQKGQLTDLAYLVLVALTKPMHGYRIMQQVKAMTGGQMDIGPASLYTTLKKLAEAGYIQQLDAAEGKKTYGITPEGIDTVKVEIKKRRQLAACGEAALKEAGL